MKSLNSSFVNPNEREVDLPKLTVRQRPRRLREALAKASRTVTGDWSRSQQSRHHPVAGEGEVAEAGAEGVRDGVADRGDGGAAACFADAERGEISGGVDQLDEHFGHLAEAQHRVALPVARGDAGGVEPHPFLQGPARGLDDAAFELV